jgi:hypothetical protein
VAVASGLMTFCTKKGASGARDCDAEHWRRSGAEELASRATECRKFEQSSILKVGHGDLWTEVTCENLVAVSWYLDYYS